MPPLVAGLNNQSSPGDGAAAKRRCGRDFGRRFRDQRNFLIQAFRLDRERRPLCQPRPPARPSQVHPAESPHPGWIAMLVVAGDEGAGRREATSAIPNL
jgi:hypothetical protein